MTKHFLIILIATLGLLFPHRLMAQFDNIEPKTIQSMPLLQPFIIQEEPEIKNDTIVPLFYPFFSKEQIEEKLKNLDTIPFPQYQYSNITYGDCFGSCNDGRTISYICPICGNETLYKTNFEWLSTIGKYAIIKNYREIESSCAAIHLLRWDIYKYRQKVEEINGVHITLDESEFCMHCSPFVKNPTLYLLTNIEGEPDTNKITKFHFGDIELLRVFLNGNLVCYSKVSLNCCKDRIKELLGITDETNKND